MVLLGIVLLSIVGWDQFKLTSQLTTHLSSQCHFKHLPTFVKPSSFEHCAVQRARARKFETICQR